MDFHSQRSGYSPHENREQAARSRRLTPLQYVTVIPNGSTKLLKRMAGTTGLEPAAAAVTNGPSPAGTRGIDRLRVRFSETVGAVEQGMAIANRNAMCACELASLTQLLFAGACSVPGSRLFSFRFGNSYGQPV